MTIQTDFEIQANKNIRHVSGTDTFTVLQLHRWLQDLADAAQSSGDDYMDITRETPSERSTDNIITLINGFNIDDATAEYLYDGSVTQEGGDVMYSGLVVVGSLAGTTTLQVVQNKVLYDGDTPFWGAGLNADATQNILMRCLIKTRATGADIDGKRILVFAREWGHTFSEFSVTMGLGNSVAAIFTSSDLNNTTASGTVAGWTTIDNVQGYQTMDLGNGNGIRPYLSQWDKDIYTINQLYERVKYLQRRGTAETLYGLDGEMFRGVTHQVLCDAPSGTPFSSVENVTWSGGEGQLLAQKKCDSTAIQINVVATAGTFTRLSGSFLTDGFLAGMPVQFTGFTNGGNNVIKTIQSVTQYVITVTSNSGLQDETGSGDERALAVLIWLQLLAGVAPTDNQTITGTTSGATAVVNTQITARSLSGVFLGQSTGAAIIGGYGVGVESGDLTVNDKLFDLMNTLQQPPNNVQWTLSGVVIDEDMILVGPKDGALNNFDFDQLTLNTTLNGAGETAVVVTTAIPSDTPTAGTIRIQLNSGIYRKVSYTSWSGSTFAIPSTDFTSDPATAPKNVMISYIDKLATSTSESFTVVYSSDRSLFVRVRDGGTAGDNEPIKTFESPSTLNSGGGSAAAIRTPDV